MVFSCTLAQAALRSGFYTCEIRINNSSEKEENTYRVEPPLHVEADGVVAALLRLDDTEHALFAVLGN